MEFSPRYLRYLSLARPAVDQEIYETGGIEFLIIDGKLGGRNFERVIKPKLPKFEDPIEKVSALKIEINGTRKKMVMGKLFEIARERLSFDNITIKARDGESFINYVPVPAAEVVLAINESGDKFVFISDENGGREICIDAQDDQRIFEELSYLAEFIEVRKGGIWEEDDWDDEMPAEEDESELDEDDNLPEIETRFQSEDGTESVYRQSVLEDLNEAEFKFTQIIRSREWLPGRIATLVERGITLKAAYDYMSGNLGGQREHGWDHLVGN